MTTATLSLNKVQRKIQTKIDAIDMPQVNWKSVCIAGFLMSLSLLIFYVWQVNNLTKVSYLMSGYEKQISALSDENKNLEISFCRK